MGEVARALGTEIVSDGEFNREVNLAFMSYACHGATQSVVEPGVVRPKGDIVCLYVCK